MNDFTNLIFENPPAITGRGRGADPNNPYALWLAALREHPGKWAKFPEPQKDGRRLTPIKRGSFHGISRGEFDAKTRKVNGSVWLYARYVG